MTTVNVPPADVHEIGLKEVARITAEMTKLAQSQGYKDLASFREAVNDDPKWKPTSGRNGFWMTTKNTSIRWSRSCWNYLDCCRSRRSRWNRSLTSPKLPRPITSRARRMGNIQGRVVVAVSNPTKRTLVDDEAIAYHEGVPGHHLQISIAQTLEGLPKFRLHGFFTAYAEGWALYSEVLGKEISFTRTLCLTMAG